MVNNALSAQKLEGNDPIIEKREKVAVTSAAKFGLIFEISNLSYPGTNVHVASNSNL